MPKHTSSLPVRVRRVTCVDDEKRIVQEELCEQTEKPIDAEVRIYHLFAQKSYFKYEL